MDVAPEHPIEASRHLSVSGLPTLLTTGGAVPSNAGLVGHRRRQLTALVRERDKHRPCPMCGYPVDQTLDRLRHPLGSVVDEWYPRYLGGDPLDPANCVQMCRLCNGVKGKRWPVTEEMRTRCRTLVEAEHAKQQPVTLAHW